MHNIVTLVICIKYYILHKSYALCFHMTFKKQDFFTQARQQAQVITMHPTSKAFEISQLPCNLMGSPLPIVHH